MKNLPTNFFVKESEGFLKKIELTDICFFTSYKGKVLAVSTNSSRIINSSLFYITELLSNDYKQNFLRCHKSYIINLDKVETIYKINNKTYNISFNGIKEQAYITYENLKVLLKRLSVL